MVLATLRHFYVTFKFILVVTPSTDLWTGAKGSLYPMSRVMKVMKKELMELERKAWGHLRRQDGCHPP